jgi:hypothetical protein
MTITISRLYNNYSDAQRAVSDLEAAGVAHPDISIVANNSDGWYSRDSKVDRDHDGVAGLGGAAGLLAGLGLLAIPGLGPVVAAGWLAATAVGAAAGAATGGVIGTLTQAGVSKEDAEIYAEGVRRGGTLVSAKVPDADRARLDAILDRSAVDMQSRKAAWQKSGWKTYDPAAKAYSADEVRKERTLYGTSV